MPSKKTSSIIPDYASSSEDDKPVPAEIKIPEPETATVVEVENSIDIAKVDPELQKIDKVESVDTRSSEPEIKEVEIKEPEPAVVTEVIEPEVVVETTDLVPEIVVVKTPVSEVVVTKPLEVPIQVEEEIPLEKRNSVLYKIGIFLLLIITIGTVGVFYMRTKISIVSETEIEATPIPTPEADIEPVAEVNLSRDEITLEILNGTSTSGLAGKVSKIFEELGYEVAEVGNADDSKINKLYVKTEYSDQLNNLLEDVEKELDIQEITEEIDDLDTTARIILGS